jgi:glucosyl-3-phosphoglycerate phosphatase
VTRLIIWRHGQTAWNASDRIQGHTDIDLDDLGRAQAVAAAARIAELHPSVIISSDLRRAAETAAALGAATGLPVHHDDRLRERYLGELQGLSGPEADAAHPEAVERWRRGEHVGAAGIEEIPALAARLSAALSAAIDRVADGGTAVVVTHGGAAKYAVGSLLDWPADVSSRVMGLANCHWSDLRRHPRRGWLLWAHNVGVTPALEPIVDRPRLADAAESARV